MDSKRKESKQDKKKKKPKHDPENKEIIDDKDRIIEICATSSKRPVSITQSTESCAALDKKRVSQEQLDESSDNDNKEKITVATVHTKNKKKSDERIKKEKAEKIVTASTETITVVNKIHNELIKRRESMNAIEASIQEIISNPELLGNISILDNETYSKLLKTSSISDNTTALMDTTDDIIDDEQSTKNVIASDEESTNQQIKKEDTIEVAVVPTKNITTDKEPIENFTHLDVESTNEQIQKEEDIIATAVAAIESISIDEECNNKQIKKKEITEIEASLSSESTVYEEPSGGSSSSVEEKDHKQLQLSKNSERIIKTKYVVNSLSISKIIKNILMQWQVENFSRLFIPHTLSKNIITIIRTNHENSSYKFSQSTNGCPRVKTHQMIHYQKELIENKERKNSSSTSSDDTDVEVSLKNLYKSASSDISSNETEESSDTSDTYEDPNA